MKTSNKVLWFLLSALFAALLAVILIIRISTSHDVGYRDYRHSIWSLIAAENKIVGDGKIISQTMPIKNAGSDFDGVDFRISSDVQVNLTQQQQQKSQPSATSPAPSQPQPQQLSTSQLPAPQVLSNTLNPKDQAQAHSQARAIITCDSNLLPYIDAYISDGTLHFYTKRNIDLIPSRDIKIAINAQNLKSVITYGAGTFHINNIKNNTFSLDVRGSGSFILQGEAKDLSVAVHGSGDVNAKNLKADNVRVDISGAGNAIVYAAQTIDINIAGSGDVQYYGSPQQVTQTLRGSGSIGKRQGKL